MIKFLNSEGLKRLVALIKQALGGKQDTLVSGTNIKTVQGTSLLGSGDVALDGGDIIYTGEEMYNMAVGDNLNECFDVLDELMNKKTSKVEYSSKAVMDADGTQPNGTIGYDRHEELWYIFDRPNGEWRRIDIEEPNEIASIATSESSASGGNNTVTITETNGTTHTFNVKNGVDGQNGVSLGDVAIADDLETDDATKVLSAKQGKRIGDDLSRIKDYEFGEATYDEDDLFKNKSYTNNTTIITGKMVNLDNYGCLMLAVTKGDKVTIASYGASGPRTYSLCDNDYNVYEVAASGYDCTSNPVTIEVTKDGYCHINCRSAAYSAFAVTHYYSTERKMLDDNTRSLTSGEMDGTSRWIVDKLQALGWEYDMKVYTNGTTTNAGGYVASPFIPCENLAGHSVTFCYMHNYSSGNFAFYNENKAFTSGHYYSTNVADKRTVDINAGWTADVYIRMTCNPDKLAECYILDNTTGEYIWKGSDYLGVIYEDNLVSYATFRDVLLSQELGESKIIAVSQNVANDIQSNVDAIGRRSYGTTATFNANTAGLLMRSEKKYDLSSLPWVDVVTYSVQGGTGGSSCRWFGFCPTITKDPQTANDYIGFKGSTWDCDFIIRRNGVAVYTASKVLTSFSSSFVVGFRLDFRRKTLLLMKRQSNGVLWSNTIDLSSYDINLGKSYLYTSSGYCCYVADTYVGWNNQINMTSFETFFSSPMVAGKFKMFNEHTYPSDDIDGGVFAPFGKMMSTWNPTKDENEHWVASFDSPSTYINLMNESPKVSSSHYLYTNWDLIIGIGKLKVVSGTLYLKAYSYYAIKDVYDLTDNLFLTATNDEYVIQEGHTIEVRGRISINSKSHLFNVKGTCTLEMWDWEAHISMNTNITPTNYDGSKVFGGIEFLNDHPNPVVDVPLVASSNYFFQGSMKYVSNKLYARVYDTSTNTYIDKQISNT